MLPTLDTSPTVIIDHPRHSHWETTAWSGRTRLDLNRSYFGVGGPLSAWPLPWCSKLTTTGPDHTDYPSHAACPCMIVASRIIIDKFMGDNILAKLVALMENIVTEGS